MGQRKKIEQAEEPGFDLPVEVKNLPRELITTLKDGTEILPRLTLAQKKKDEKRRDQLMRLHGSAARLSSEERDLAHAYIRVDNYKQEVARLKALTTASFKERGQVRVQDIRAELERAMHNLTDALVDCGQLPEAYSAIAEVAHKIRKKERQADIERLHAAVTLPDDEHCPCPPELKHIERRLWIPERQQFVDFLSCPCRHLNATNTLPAELLNLHRARAKAEKGAKDEVVLNLAKHPSITT
jgi:hypothetical protein